MRDPDKFIRSVVERFGARVIYDESKMLKEENMQITGREEVKVQSAADRPPERWKPHVADDKYALMKLKDEAVQYDFSPLTQPSVIGKLSGAYTDNFGNDNHNLDIRFWVDGEGVVSEASPAGTELPSHKGLQRQLKAVGAGAVVEITYLGRGEARNGGQAPCNYRVERLKTDDDDTFV